MAAPILWTDRDYLNRARRPAKRWNADGKLEPVTDDLGRPAFERVPQTGRVGVVRQVEDIASTKPMQEVRSVKMLRDDGHEVHCPIRSAAAAGHGEKGSDNSMSRYVFAKAKHNGWIPEGACPVDLVLRRERSHLQLYSQEVRKAVERRDACAPHEVGAKNPPCRHYVAERDARGARRLKEHEAQEARNKSAAERTTDALVSFVEKMAPAGAAPVAAEQEFAPRKGGGK